MSLQDRIIEVRLSNPSWSSSKIAARVGCPAAYVRVALRRSGIKLNTVPRQLQDWEKQSVIDDYKAGVKLDSIAEEFSMSISGISLVAKRAGLPRRTNRGPTKNYGRVCEPQINNS